jgi:NAD(P)-dependent dehydrogenase (short-subunit alcohol dehydrogenase family)
LAVELAPIRVNSVSPGTIDGHLWRSRPDDVRIPAFEQFASATTLGRVGVESEVADARCIRTVVTHFADA